MLFEDSAIPCVVTLHFKNKSPAQQNSVYELQWIDIHDVMLIKAVVAVKWVLFTGRVFGFRGVTTQGPSAGDSFVVKPLLYSGAKAIGKEALNTGSNIIADMLNKEQEQPVDDIFKNRFIEAKDNEQKI